jgi:hypothetical protein
MKLHPASQGCRASQEFAFSIDHFVSAIFLSVKTYT